MSSTRIIRCALCGKRLKDGRWIYSQATRQHYCYYGHCRKRKARDE